VRWYFTDLDFQTHESIINSRDWDEDKGNDYLLGEQLQFPWNYNGAEKVDGLIGGHECGQESDFQAGQPWPYDGPPIEYGEDWIPLCCPRELILSAQAGAVVPPPLMRTRTTAGASVDYLKPPPPILSVTAGAVVDTLPPMRGPTAGAVADVPVMMPTARAGASVDYIPGVVAESTVQAGAAADLGVAQVQAQGGASVDYLPGGTNDSCEHAFVAELGDEMIADVVFPGPTRWFRINDVPAGNYVLQIRLLSGIGSIIDLIEVYSGVSCTGKAALFATSMQDKDEGFTTDFDHDLFISIGPPTFETVVSVKVVPA